MAAGAQLGDSSAVTWPLPCFAGCDGCHLLCSQQDPSGPTAGARAVVQPGPAQRHEETDVHAVVAPGPTPSSALGTGIAGIAGIAGAATGALARPAFPRSAREGPDGNFPVPPRSASLSASFPASHVDSGHRSHHAERLGSCRLCLPPWLPFMRTNVFPKRKPVTWSGLRHAVLVVCRREQASRSWGPAAEECQSRHRAPEQSPVP